MDKNQDFHYLTEELFLGDISDLKKVSASEDNDIHRPFDKVEIDKESLNSLGTIKKRFVRTKGSVLLSLFEKKKNHPDLNIVSCIDDLLSDPNFTQSDFENTYISTIVKELRYGNFKYAQADIISCAIASALGVKSAYATFDASGDLLISVDFLQDKQELVDFGEFTDCRLFEASYPINNIMLLLEKGMRVNLSNEKDIFEKERKQILIDFIRMYIVRRLVLKDDDFSRNNIGFVHSKDCEDYSVAPVYDMEYSLGESKGFVSIFAPAHEDEIYNSIEYLLDNYPEETMIAMKDINVYSDKEKMQELYKIIDENSTSLRGNSQKEFLKDNMFSVCNSFNRLLYLKNFEDKEVSDDIL